MEKATTAVHIQLSIGGMTCINCQNKIEKELQYTEGIIDISVSYNNGTADIVYDQTKISLKEIISVIEKLDYEVLPEQGKRKNDLMDIICMLVIIVALYVMLQSMGILNLLAPSRLADSKMGYGMLFVIGLITSVHCIAMCGGINLSQCLPQSRKQEMGNDSKLAAFLPALSYNLGRVVSYTVIGFALGLIGFVLGGGAEVGLSALLQGSLKMIAGLFMIIMGINMLDLFPWLRKLTIRMPKAAALRIGQEKAKHRRPFLVGILNGFMPCGPLQSMWIVALATGNPFAGALSMFLFSLGTVPLMLGLGSIVSALGRKFTDKVMTVGAVLVVVLGLAMLSQGGTLSGWLSSDLLLALLIAFCIAGVLLSIPVKSRAGRRIAQVVSLVIIIGSCTMWNSQAAEVQSVSETDTELEVVDGVQVVNSTLMPGRYPNITVQAGVPVKWVIDAPEGSINGCNYKMIIQDYGIEHTFQTGENIIEFTPETVGTVTYSCWMGMIHGNIFVVDEEQGEAAASDAGTAAVEADTVVDADVDVPTPAGYTIPTENLAIAALKTDENGNTYQEVTIQLTDEGFAPAVVVLQSNIITIWNIDNQMEDAGNSVELLAPYYSTKLSLQEGVNQLNLYPGESFDVSTGDNRFYCYVKVVDDLETVDEEAVREEADSFETLIYPATVFESAGMSCCG